MKPRERERESYSNSYNSGESFILDVKSNIINNALYNITSTKRGIKIKSNTHDGQTLRCNAITQIEYISWARKR